MNGQMIDAGGADFDLTLRDELTPKIGRAVDKAVDKVRKFGPAVAETTRVASSAITALRDHIDADIKYVGRRVKGVGKAIMGIGAGITAVGAVSSIGLIRAADDAGNFAETVNMFQAVFQNQSDAARRWSINFGNEVGRSEAKLLQFMAGAQDTFVPLGFDREQAADLSKTVTKLTVDLASFKNMAEEDVFRRVIGGLVGNTENLKAFGVQANMATIRARALQEGFDPRNLTSYQKALVILKILLDGTADAQGDAARTADSYANSKRALTAQLERFKVLIGQPVKDAIAALNIQITRMLSSINDFLDRFPKTAGTVAIVTASIVGLGLAVTTAGAALTSYGGILSTLGIAAYGTLYSTNLSIGKLTAGIGKATTALAGLLARFKTLGGMKVPAIKVPPVNPASASGAAVGIASRIKTAITAAIGSALTKIRGASLLGMARAVGSMFVSGFKNAIPFLRSALSKAASMFGGKMMKFGLHLAALLGGIQIGKWFGKRHFENLMQTEKKFGEWLETKRVAALAKTYRDMGQEVPADLFKTLDVNNAKVVKPQGTELSDADRELALTINNSQTALEEFNAAVASAQRLLDTGEINQSQFDRFKQTKQAEYRAQNEQYQAAKALREQLQTPIETFRAAVNQAKQAFANDPQMLARAMRKAQGEYQDAMAAQRNTPAAMAAKSLRTAAEVFRDAVRDARRTFLAADPNTGQGPDKEAMENFRRAVELAREQLRASNPVDQIRQSLETPLESFQRRMRDIAAQLKDVAPSIRKALLDRARKRGEKELRDSDPDTQKALSIRESLKTQGQRFVDEMRKVNELVRKGKLTDGEARDFATKRRKEILGEKPREKLFQTMGISNAFQVASLGRFAPAMDPNREAVEYAKRSVELQKEMVVALKETGRKRPVFR